MKSAPRIAVLTGYGLNCEKETAYVFEKCGGIADLIHINDLINKEKSLAPYQIAAFIGGFSFGDHVASGRVLAIKFKYHLKEELLSFLKKDSLIIGICNGFQTLVKLGVLPGFQSELEQKVTLTHNEKIGYQDRWVKLRFNPQSSCVFTKGLDYLETPVRHGEGRFLIDNKETLSLLEKNQQIVCQYVHPETNEPTQEFPYNPNGSIKSIAGICSPEGKIFGLMPHPEAFHSIYNHPRWTHMDIENYPLPLGLKIFQNAVNYFS